MNSGINASYEIQFIHLWFSKHQLKEMGGNRIKGPADSGKLSEQSAEKKKGFSDWMNFIKPGNEEKDHWVSFIWRVINLIHIISGS